MSGAAAQTIVRLSGCPAVRLSGGRLAELERFVAWDTRINTEPLVRRGFGALARVHDALRAANFPSAARTAPQANHVFAAEAAAATRLGAERMRSWGDEALCWFADDVGAADEPLVAGQLTQIVHGDL